MKLAGRTTARVAFFLAVVLSSSSSVHGLICHCKEFINIELLSPPPGCYPNGTCATDTGQCFVDLTIAESGHKRHKYSCVEHNPGDQINRVYATCSLDVPSATQIVLCCNDTDYCNGHLNPDEKLLTDPSMSPTPTPRLTDESRTNQGPDVRLIIGIAAPLFVAAVALSMTLFLVCVYYLRRHKLAVERNRRVPQGMKEAKPTGEMELMDMTVTSGSGSGLPFLIQRTVARTIKITELIGNGRYGQVYLGYYQGEPVAVKKFFSRDEKSWCRETEIYNTLLLRHDNILGFFASDMVSNNGVTELWLITQYHQFGSLYDFLMQEAVSPKVMLLMAISMCSGLAHLHTELFGTQAKPAITHRDMKTKNVLVKNNMTCCIADFGLAVFKNQNEMNIPTNPKQGTKRYMAPEILNETINMMSFESFKHVDVYALGLILWELCRRCTGTSGVPEDYEVPLQGMVPPDPSFEDMRRVVVVERRQPAIPPRWNTEELLREVTKVMRECWYYTSTARPTAVYLKKKLLKMSQELEKMNYGDHDVQQAT